MALDLSKFKLVSPTGAPGAPSTIPTGKIDLSKFKLVSPGSSQGAATTTTAPPGQQGPSLLGSLGSTIKNAGQNLFKQATQKKLLGQTIEDEGKNIVGTIAGSMIPGGQFSGVKNLFKKAVNVGAKGAVSSAVPFVQPFVTTAANVVEPALGIKGLPKDLNLPYGNKVSANPGVGESLGNAASAALWEAPIEKLLAPVVEGMGSVGRGILDKGGEIFTGVDKAKIGDWYNLVKKTPDEAKAVIDTIEKNPQNPFLGLGQKIVDRLGEMKKTAQEAWETASEAFKSANPKARFDLTGTIGDLKKIIGNFGVTLDSDGQIVAKGTINPFTKSQTDRLQGLIDLLKKSSNFTVDDLNAIGSKFDAAYNAERFNNDMSPTKYHAAVSSLKEGVSNFIHETLPPELQAANQKYEDYYEAYQKLGSKISDGANGVKNGAETFLGNIMNMNKGSLRQDVADAGQRIGIDVLKEAKNLNIAKDMTQLVPQTTKNRTMDFIRAIVSNKALASVIGGGEVVTGHIAAAVPAVLANVLSSPNSYRQLIEALAGTASKLPIGEAIKSIPPDELKAVIQIIGRSAPGVTRAAVNATESAVNSLQSFFSKTSQKQRSK